MYATSTASTTTSGSGRAMSASADERRVRVVRLLRPRRAAPAFGFSLRGGREYSAGFFISKVEFNSEAHVQGLKVGDQLVSVNGYRVDDAVHSELLHYLASQSRLKLKVRHVGMLPIKEKTHEPLSWQFISERASIGSDVSSSPTLCHETDRMTDLRLSILVPPSAKLGCGICKGPEWKPGIFVQFVREGGIAREAGLRPGDQILSCNGVNFTNVTFNEAISAMKAVGRLELVVREGAGTELVSPESSGYNSSASSAAGERSPAPVAPPAALRRRLASVAEEAADRVDRLTMNKFKRRTWDSLDFEWKNSDVHNFDAPSDIEPDYDSPSIPNNPHTFESKNIDMRIKNIDMRTKNIDMRTKNKRDFVTSPSNRTIINLTEEGATIQCSYDNNQLPRNNNFATTNRSNDKKTIVVEVHHTTNNNSVKNNCNFPPPMNDISLDTTSAGSSATLSSAIAEEFQKRLLKKKNSSPEMTVPSNTKKVVPPKPVENEKKKQHDALMDEFKKVHKKMFANLDESDAKTEYQDRDKDTEATEIDRQQTLPLRRADTTNGVMTNGSPHKRMEAPDVPPPPPPMPTAKGHLNGNCKIEQKPLPPAVNLKAPNFRKNGTLTRTPTPDYNNKIDINTIIKNVKDDKAELESLESYKLKNPASAPPKPPPNYFMKAPNGTLKKQARPVSVTIGEYAYGAGRKEPTKLEFLNGDKPDGPQTNGDHDTSISNRLQSELVLTLSRSNLRKKTETDRRMSDKKINDIIDVNGNSDSSLDKNFHVRYGNNLLPLPPSITIPKVSKTMKNLLQINTQ